MTIEEIYKGYGSNWTTAMRELKLSPGAYKHWVKVGYIPPHTQRYIEAVTRGRFVASNFNQPREA